MVESRTIKGTRQPAVNHASGGRGAARARPAALGIRHPPIESGILLAAVAAVALNAFFSGAEADEAELREATMASAA